MGVGVRGLTRGLSIHPQGNQEPLVVKDRVGRPTGELGVSKPVECDRLPFSAVVGRQEWHLACENLGIGLLVVRIAPVVTIMSTVLSFNKIQNGDILVPNYMACPRNWLLNECHQHRDAIANLSCSCALMEGHCSIHCRCRSPQAAVTH